MITQLTPEKSDIDVKPPMLHVLDERKSYPPLVQIALCGYRRDGAPISEGRGRDVECVVCAEIALSTGLVSW